MIWGCTAYFNWIFYSATTKYACVIWIVREAKSTGLVVSYLISLFNFGSIFLNSIFFVKHSRQFWWSFYFGNRKEWNVIYEFYDWSSWFIYLNPTYAMHVRILKDCLSGRSANWYLLPDLQVFNFAIQLNKCGGIQWNFTFLPSLKFRDKIFQVDVWFLLFIMIMRAAK